MAGAGKKGKKKWGGGMCGHRRPRRGILHVQVGRVKKKKKEHFWEEQKQRGRRERFFRLWVTVVTQAVI